MPMNCCCKLQGRQGWYWRVLHLTRWRLGGLIVVVDGVSVGTGAGGVGMFDIVLDGVDACARAGVSVFVV